jgi:hypothetical protein
MKKKFSAIPMMPMITNTAAALASALSSLVIFDTFYSDRYRKYTPSPHPPLDHINDEVHSAIGMSVLIVHSVYL